MQGIIDELRFVEDLDEEFRISLEKVLKESDEYDKDSVRAADTPYTTVVHRDLWTNNIMIKKGKSSILFI